MSLVLPSSTYTSKKQQMKDAENYDESDWFTASGDLPLKVCHRTNVIPLPYFMMVSRHHYPVAITTESFGRRQDKGWVDTTRRGPTTLTVQLCRNGCWILKWEFVSNWAPVWRRTGLILADPYLKRIDCPESVKLSSNNSPHPNKKGVSTLSFFFILATQRIQG